MAWSSRRIYELARIMIYALLGIFLICVLIAAVTGMYGYAIYEVVTIIARGTMIAGAVVAPIAAIAGAHAFYTGQLQRKRKQPPEVSDVDQLQRIYNQLSSEDENYLRNQLAQQRLAMLDEDEEAGAASDAPEHKNDHEWR
ncbi:hypothetical protein G4Y79_02340 [Phototrophicus methaneseepsis]|uniref:Uncharacterized protein n=1 Tax=Phototrophicus methaneseepsis TaxID=2710758 RepID=A0A7S8IE26_9CHLR|nr:hypothetical protein [Phototrophicus methaneseepsis]QPC83235.1 hypothetical protein G4Y79_02340 [Phototrophicus methaneseepsis]